MSLQPGAWQGRVQELGPQAPARKPKHLHPIPCCRLPDPLWLPPRTVQICLELNCLIDNYLRSAPPTPGRRIRVAGSDTATGRSDTEHS